MREEEIEASEGFESESLVDQYFYYIHCRYFVGFNAACL